MQTDLSKQVPFSMEAEQAVLGSILIKPSECFEAIGGLITEDDFYITEHKAIFSAMQDMFVSSKRIDTVTLINTMVESGGRDQAGSTQYLAQLAQIVPSAANIRDYANIVHDKSLLRRLIEASEKIMDMGYAEQGKAEEIVDVSEQLIFDLAQKKQSKQMRHIRDVIPLVYKNLEELSENKNAVKGVQTGFSQLDRVLVEMSGGDLVLIGARPGMGKTSFAMNIASNYASKSDKAVAVFSLEMPAEQIVTRMLSSEALVDSRSLRAGEIRPEDWEQLATAADKLAQCNILIDDTSSISVTDVKSKLRRIKNLGLVIIDYLQLMNASKKYDGNRVQEVGDISRNLKIMAKELSVPIICCAQLSRGPEGRTDSKRPRLSDLRDSGAIEQDADMVLFLYRDEYYKETDAATADQEQNTAEIIVAKNRHGAVGTVRMGWIAQFTKFRTLEEGIEAPNE